MVVEPPLSRAAHGLFPSAPLVACELSASRDRTSANEVKARTPILKVGAFRAAPRDPAFRETYSVEIPVLVFPRTTVRIVQDRREPFVSNPGVVTCYNQGDSFRRDPIDSRGDRCDWFALAPGALAAVFGERGRAIDPAAPFAAACFAIDAETYLLQRLVVRHIEEEASPDLLLVEEAGLEIARRIAANLPDSGAEAKRSRGAASNWDRELVTRLETILCLRYAENLSLAELAERMQAPLFRLCRAFRRVRGTSIHAYRTTLRLRAALERIPEASGELSALALDLGFSSHAHFTGVFRRHFGLTPSEFWRGARASSLEQLTGSSGRFTSSSPGTSSSRSSRMPSARSSAPSWARCSHLGADRLQPTWSARSSSSVAWPTLSWCRRPSRSSPSISSSRICPVPGPLIAWLRVLPAASRVAPDMPLDGARRGSASRPPGAQLKSSPLDRRIDSGSRSDGRELTVGASRWTSNRSSWTPG